MNYNKIILFVFIFFLSTYIQETKAQASNINGDTIFVNMSKEIQFIFPTLPTSFITVPANSQYNIMDSRTGINLIAKSENYQPVTLFVTEAQRSHRFILLFKKDDDVRLFYDYSTEQKLAQHINETELAKLNQEKAAINIEPIKPEKKKNKAETTVTAPVNKVSKQYILLTEEAQNKINQKKYAEARNIYQLTLSIKPGDAYVTQQLQIVNNLIAEENTQTKNKKIDTANKKIDTANVQKELRERQLTAEKNYDSAVKTADSFFNAGNYENAKREYNKALQFSNKDWPKSQINKINKIISDQLAQAKAEKKEQEQQQKLEQQKLEQQKLEQQRLEQQQKTEQQQKIATEPAVITDSVARAAEIKKKYNVAIANGRSNYLNNDLMSAKTFYEEAMSLQPSQQLPKNQLKIINKKLEIINNKSGDSTTETPLDVYGRTIILADSLVIAKAYDAAIASYREALVLKPLESYPWKQIKYIQSQITLDEKRKREQREQQFNDALTRADKAVADKKYDDAKSAYTEALSFHPENEYAKKRLEIASYQLQLEKERMEKLRQDSSKEEVVPVKKSKRKRSSP